MATESELVCVLQCGTPCSASDSLENITLGKWESIRSKSLRWKGLDKFQNKHGNVDWEKGPKGHYMHHTCYTSLSSTRGLSQAETRKRKIEECHEREEASSERDPSPVPSYRSSKQLRSGLGTLHDKSLCIWCMKGQHKSSNRDKQLLLLSTKDAWAKFKLHTVRLDDEVLRSRLDTLIASIPDCQTAFGLEIRYHRCCWRKYVSDFKTLTDESTDHLQGVNLREAQAIFFHYIRQVIFKDHEFRTLQNLLQDYNRIISNYGHISIVRSSYLKDILIKEFGEDIGFHERLQKNVSELVYDRTSAGSYVEAALSSLGISDDQLVMNVAARLRDQVMRTNTVPWVPHIPDLEMEEDLSDLLLKLITWLKHPNRTKVDESPSVRSIASILTSHITGRHTTFEVNLSVLLHGLTKSREIVDLMHKDGLGISYNDVLLLRDFWVVTDLKCSTDCPMELAVGKPAIAIVDNDDFKSDTLTGAGQSHRTNVMFVQPESFEADLASQNHGGRPVSSVDLASNLSTTLRELGKEMQNVQPYKTVKRGEPPIGTPAEDSTPPDTSIQRTRGVIHALARAEDDRTRPKPEEQTVPAFSGFQSKMSNADEKSRAIYHMTYSTPPSKSILYDVMQKLAKSIEEKKMPFATIVGDHPVYVLMLELKNENAELFSKVLPFMGTFHVQMSFIYTIYKRFKGSGISDVLVAAGVIADGSVDQALRGKHFKRGVRCLRLFYETLVHHALNKRLEGSPLSEEVKASLSKLRHQIDAEELADTYAQLERSTQVKDLVDSLFMDYDGAPQAEYWLSFLEMVEILTQNIHAIRSRNWTEFKSSLKLMLPWMQIYDNDKYGRHLPDFISVLDNLPADQAAFMESGMFAQSMTGNPYSCVALDIWIESTMNKGSKLKSGWLAILNNEKQLLSNTRNVNNINRVRAAVHRHASRKKRGIERHADCSSSKMKKDEQAVQDISACLTEFKCDPFDQTDQTLRSLQSGIPASDTLAADLKSAKSDGTSKVRQFMNERVYSKTKSLNDSVPCSKRINFSTQEVKKADDENLNGKSEEMERKALASVLGLVVPSGALQLENVLQHRVPTECLSNRTMRKTQKSKLQEKLTMTVIGEPNLYTSIIDMGLIWRLATPTVEDREKGDGTKYTWGDYAEKVVNCVLKRHKHAERIICVNDSYQQDFTIKDSERMLRQKNLTISNVFMKAEDKFPSTKDFHVLLGKPENKVRLQGFLRKEFQKTAAADATEIIYCVVGDTAKNLSTGEDVPELTCLHAEADTAMFTIYSVLRSDGYKAAVVMDTEDTDNYVQAAYVAQRTQGILCLKRKHQLIDAQRLCSEAMSTSIIPLHVLTGCDHNSGFYGASKKAIADRLEKCKEAQDLLVACGGELPVTEEVISDLEQFVIRFIYRDPKSKTPKDARATKWRAQKKKSTIRLVPDSDSLYWHLKRANYLAYLMKHYQLLCHPSPIGHGWHLVDGLCLPVRSTEPPLPPSMPSLTQPESEVNSAVNSESEDSGSNCPSSSDSESSSD